MAIALPFAIGRSGTSRTEVIFGMTGKGARKGAGKENGKGK
jgi:hypothetical protein